MLGPVGLGQRRNQRMRVELGSRKKNEEEDAFYPSRGDVHQLQRTEAGGRLYFH
jgi:hypothetical protein